MEFTLLYWHWIALGMLLVISEMFIPSFTIIWFGLGAILVGLVLLVVPDLGVNWQIFSWAVSSVFFIFLWFRFLKPRMADKTKAGLSREAVLGESGQVLKVPIEGERGIVRFTTPLLGSDEWPFICQQGVEIGDRVFVCDVSGNTLIVEKRS